MCRACVVINSSLTQVVFRFQIDWTESKEHHRVCILEGVDKRLDDNRRTYHGLHFMLVGDLLHLYAKPAYNASSLSRRSHSIFPRTFIQTSVNL